MAAAGILVLRLSKQAMSPQAGVKLQKEQTERSEYYYLNYEHVLVTCAETVTTGSVIQRHVTKVRHEPSTGGHILL